MQTYFFNFPNFNLKNGSILINCHSSEQDRGYGRCRDEDGAKRTTNRVTAISKEEIDKNEFADINFLFE